MGSLILKSIFFIRLIILLGFVIQHVGLTCLTLINQLLNWLLLSVECRLIRSFIVIVIVITLILLVITRFHVGILIIIIWVHNSLTHMMLLLLFSLALLIELRLDDHIVLLRDLFSMLYIIELEA